MGQVLVLNATYEPLSVVTVKRAVVLLLKEKAELIEAAEARLRAESFSIPMPLVIRLVYYVKIPRRISLPVTRKTVLARDNYTCQYCLGVPPRQNLTMDHVLPRSRGGKTTWENVVTACQKCNGFLLSVDQINVKVKSQAFFSRETFGAAPVNIRVS